MQTFEHIKTACGWSGRDNIGKAWKAKFGAEVPMPGNHEALPDEIWLPFLKHIARPIPNKPAAVIQGALHLLENHGREIQTPAAIVVNGHAPKPVLVRKKTTHPKPAHVDPVEAAKAEAIINREAEDRAKREAYDAEAKRRESEAARLDAQTRPWITALTWVLNELEMMLLIFGFWYIAGFIGLFAGVFMAFLGNIVLLTIRLRGAAADLAIYCWLAVCGFGGWLVEYPAIRYGIETAGTIVNEAGHTYAGITVQTYSIILTVLMSGSSFAGALMRYYKGREA